MVAKKSKVNKMHPQNLATCMAPNILYRKPEEEKALAPFLVSKEMAPAVAIITVLIQKVEFFFAKDNHVDSKIEIENEEKEG